MMKLLLFLTFLFVNTLWGQDDVFFTRAKQFTSLSQCYKGVTFSPDWMIHHSGEKQLQVLVLGDKAPAFIIETSLRVTDFQVEGNQLYILTLHHLEEWDLLGQKLLRTIDLTLPSEALGLSLYGNKIFIAQDRDGLTVIDKVTGGYIESIPLPGETTDLTIADGVGFALSESTEIIGSSILAGIFSFNLDTHDILKKTLLNGAPGGSIEQMGNFFYVGSSFFWALDKKKVATKKLINSYSRVYLPSGEFARGRPFVDEKHLYFCGESTRPIVIKISKT